MGRTTTNVAAPKLGIGVLHRVYTGYAADTCEIFGDIWYSHVIRDQGVAFVECGLYAKHGGSGAYKQPIHKGRLLLCDMFFISNRIAGGI